MKTFNGKRIISMVLVLVMALMSVVGCSGNESTEETTESTTALVAEYGTEPQIIDPEEVALKAGDIELKAYELFYGYISVKTTLEMYYGITDWAAELYTGYTNADYLKSTVESQMLNIAYLVQKAEELGIELTDEELETAKEEITSVYEALTEEEKEVYGFTEENLLEVNKHMKLANATMEKLQSDAEAALTEEELASCEYRSIQHILISTMEGPAAETAESETVDAAAQEEYLAQQLELAEEVLAKAKAGEDFEALAEEYTADSGVSYSINADGQTPDGATMVTEFAEAANALGEGEISDIVETQYGYHIIKCVSLSDEDAKEEAIYNLAYTNISNAYTEWLESCDYSFSDFWTNYVIINPEAIVETEAETTEETEAAADTVTETE